MNQIVDIYRQNKCVYGVRKMWHAARRAGLNGLALGRSAVLSSKLFPQVEALWRGLTQGHWVEDRPARQVKTAKHEGVGSSAQHDPAQERGEHLVDQPQRHQRIMPGHLPRTNGQVTGCVHSIGHPQGR